MTIHARGTAVNLMPELMVRQVLMEGIVELAADKARLTEMFERVDELYGGSQQPLGLHPTWADDMHKRVREYVSTPGLLKVAVGYPQDPAVLPYYSIIIESGGESGDEAVTGDIASETFEQQGVPTADDETASIVIAHTTLATGWSSTVQVGTWSCAPEESVMLAACAREVMFRDKGRLLLAGVHDVSFTESGFATDSASPLAPVCGYVPVLRCVMRWTLRTTKREGPIPTRVTTVGGTFSN